MAGFDQGWEGDVLSKLESEGRIVELFGDLRERACELDFDTPGQTDSNDKEVKNDALENLACVDLAFKWLWSQGRGEGRCIRHLRVPCMEIL